ncbi:cell division suppressor protein YneA [Edaphobacillus lindanitolerans]|uniref:LysM domain-containing protein n=1 Tax=Edaphobacillus lindanitolerans TaxID=550447 RepID=A0A1U7PLH5_9BACI|nr:hypothetical protein [Edaphobacillus lindanitolerans]SIT66920.1 hypothetical protein SAMN05428946_0144 [Edaphobacillus lindanitolerans]
MDFIRKHSFSFSFILLAVIVAFAMPDGHEESTVSTMELMVTEGDSLMSLHSQTDTSLPADRWVEEVLRLNGKEDTRLLAGETLIVPALPAYSDGILLAGEDK